MADCKDTDDRLEDDFMESFRKSYAKRKLEEVARFRLGMCGVSDNTEKTDTFDTDKAFSVHR